MTDTIQQPALPALQVNAQYIKDLSFEVPGAPNIFNELTQAPEVTVQVNVQNERLRENVYEVTIHLNVAAKTPDATAFIAELIYGGVFTLGVPEEHLEPVLFIECPRLLFPFARNIVADITRDGGFPPIILQPLDFVGLYRSRVEQIMQQNTAGRA